MEHKISRAVIAYAVERQAGTLAVGDVRDVANKTDKGAVVNQKLSTWRHGKLRDYLAYKAEAEGIVVVLVDERYTSQTCPDCGCRHKPRGRMYTCGQCGFSRHRDVVGAAGYPLGDPQSSTPWRPGQGAAAATKVSSPDSIGQA